MRVVEALAEDGECVESGALALQLAAVKGNAKVVEMVFPRGGPTGSSNSEL